MCVCLYLNLFVCLLLLCVNFNEQVCACDCLCVCVCFYGCICVHVCICMCVSMYWCVKSLPVHYTFLDYSIASPKLLWVLLLCTVMRHVMHIYCNHWSDRHSEFIHSNVNNHITLYAGMHTNGYSVSGLFPSSLWYSMVQQQHCSHSQSTHVCSM